MVIQYVDYAAQFQALATSATSKISELLRLYNARTTKLILGAGAIHGAARLKSINAKHLALVMQSLHLILIVLPHVRAALMAQLPNKQHALLTDLDIIKRDYTDHIDKVVSKFVSIIGGIVEHGLAPSLVSTSFDERHNNRDAEALTAEKCCPFLSGIASNTKKMHQVLSSLLPSDDLMDVFSRIFVYLDSKIPTILISYDSDQSNTFSLPITNGGKYQLIDEVEIISQTLNSLPGTLAWEFSAAEGLKRRLGLTISTNDNSPVSSTVQNEEVGTVSEDDLVIRSQSNNHVTDPFQKDDCQVIVKNQMDGLSPNHHTERDLQDDEHGEINDSRNDDFPQRVEIKEEITI
jgi:vacuolar protein sorting-associated protein 54